MSCIKELMIIIGISIMLYGCQNSHTDTKEGQTISRSNSYCRDLPSQFQSYQEAQSYMLTAQFRLEDDVSTDKSSWIRGASYYSCDGLNGYLQLSTDKQSYLFEGVPVDLWEQFKTAESFGSFYNAYIRDRFRMLIGG